MDGSQLQPSDNGRAKIGASASDTDCDPASEGESASGSENDCENDRENDSKSSSASENFFAR